MQTRDDGPARVLYVGADRDAARSAAAGIERACDHLSIVTASSRDDGLETLRTRGRERDGSQNRNQSQSQSRSRSQNRGRNQNQGFACIVCEVHAIDGEDESPLEFVDEVHERDPHVPFVLVARETGSEALAVEAFRRGVADYVQVGAETESLWPTLVDRIDAAITRARAERDRRRAAAVVETSTDLVCTVDEGGVVTYVSPSVERVLGYTPAAVRGEQGLEFVHPDDRDVVRETVGKLVDNPTWEPTVEFRTKCADGNWTVVEASCHNHLDDPTIDGIVVVGRDAGVRADNTCQLRALHETTRRLMKARTHQKIADVTIEAARNVLRLPVNGVYFHDEASDRLVPVAITRRGEELFEETPTFERGDGIVWTVFRTGRPQVYDDVTSDPDVYDPETPIRSELVLPLGDHGVFVAGSTDVGDFEDRTVSLANVLAANVERALDRASRQDELKAREQELAAQNERLERFSSIVAHDLRSPLTVVSGNLDLAMTDSEEGDGDGDGEGDRDGDRDDVDHDYDHDHDHSHDYHRYLDEAASALERMERIIDDLLWLAREGREIGSVTTVELNRVTRFAWGHVDTDGATLEAADIPDVRFQADEDRIVQLFENLFRNAVEHGSTNGQNANRSDDSVDHGFTNPAPRTRRDAVERGPAVDRTQLDHDTTSDTSDVTVRVDAGDDWLAVEDTGRGVPEAKRDLIFDTGYSTSADGTGYGLSIVETIVTAHDWEIDVTDGSDGGARFEITGIESLEWGSETEMGVETGTETETKTKTETENEIETDDTG